MKFIIEEKVKELGIKAKGVIIEGLDNTNISDEYLSYREESIKKH